LNHLLELQITTNQSIKGDHMATNPITAKLTKKVLMTAPEGAFLASNLMKSAKESVFSETVSSRKEREQQWQRIVASKVDQRVCRIFATEAEFAGWLSAVLTPPDQRVSLS
jgi:hypothetical protein